MVINTQTLQEKCKKIVDVIGSTDKKTESLELKCEDNEFTLSFTNKEFYVKIVTAVDQPDNFRVIVEAKKFLSLVAKTTSETITLKYVDKENEKYLSMKGNGNYKFPVALNAITGEMGTVPVIGIDNVVNEFTIPNTVLQSILKYNAKIFTTGESLGRFPYLYVDEKGAITIVNSACINSFTLEQPVAIYLTEKLVKLFKLFKAEDVGFELGYDEVANGIIQQKIRLSEEGLTLCIILTTDKQITNNFPAEKLRAVADRVSPHTVVVAKDALVDALDRLSLFKSELKDSANGAIRLVFGIDGVTVEDYTKNNSEVVDYANACETLSIAEVHEYEALFNPKDLSLILDNCEDTYLTLSFGSGALFITKANIKNIIPEYRKNER